MADPIVVTVRRYDGNRAVALRSERDLVRRLVPGATCSFVRDSQGRFVADPVDIAVIDLDSPIGALLHPGHSDTLDGLCFHAVRAMAPKTTRLTIPRETQMRVLMVTATPVIDDENGEPIAVMCRGALHRSVASLAYVPRFGEDDFARALRDDEFVLRYQPIHNIRTGALAGAEALVRWQHPSEGLIAPLDFIAEAEQTGDIVEIGHWVMLEACIEAAGWSDPEMVLSVNVSAHQVRSGTLLQTVRTALSASGLAPHRLTLELTETQLISERTSVASLIGHLRSLGVNVAIDDFGTGYSSLSRVQQHRGNVIKIDRSLIRELHESAEVRRVLEAVVALVKAVGCVVVAEGVTTAEELVVLREIGLDYSQGYVHAHPMPADEFATYARVHHHRRVSAPSSCD